MKQRQESINEVHPPMSSDPPISRLIIFLYFYLVAAEDFFVASSDLVDSLIDHSLFGFLGHLRRARKVFRHGHKNKTTSTKSIFPQDSIGKACGVARKQHKPLPIGWMSSCRIFSTIPSRSVSERRCIPSGRGDEKKMSASTEHRAGYESEVNQLLTNLQVTNDPLKSNQSCLLVTTFPRLRVDLIVLPAIGWPCLRTFKVRFIIHRFCASSHRIRAPLPSSLHPNSLGPNTFHVCSVIREEFGPIRLLSFPFRRV